MKKVKKASNLRRAMSSVEQSNRNYLKATHNRAERSVSMNTNSGAGGFNSLLRQDKMSSFERSSSSSGSTQNLYRSQSMASLGMNADKMVLGEGFRNTYTLMRPQKSATMRELGLNTKALSRIPKTPRPSRAMDIFNASIKGLRDHVKNTDTDYMKAEDDYRLKSSSSNAQRLKTIERHKKKLEYLLSKVEELHDHYQVQHHMREGTKALSKAYETSSGQHRKDSMMNVHYGFKECSKTMCAIEAQLESMLGQFHCEMKGIMGFARVMPGDTFEVSIRHGNQKWKSKGHVSKDSEQKWDQDKRALNVQICSSLTVKVFESKRLSRSSLGEKHCDILGLFAANPQILTVNVNDIGTIKLNILVQWMPLSNFTDKMKYYDPPPRDSLSPRPLSVIAPMDEAVSPISTLQRPVHKASSPTIEMVPAMNRKPDILCDMVDDTAQGSNVRTLADAIEEEEEGDVYEWPQCLEKAVHKLRDALDEYQEHSSSVRSLCDLIIELDGILTNPDRGQSKMLRDISEPVCILNTQLSDSSHADEHIDTAFDFLNEATISLAIESAFEFLDLEDCDDDSDTETEPDTSTSTCGTEVGAMSPTSTSRSYADSGIESLLVTQRSRRSDTPTIYSTGNDELDHVIIQHCALSEVLLENLGNVGMLKSKERSALLIIKQQRNVFTKIISLLHQMTKIGDTHINVHDILADIIPQYKEVHEFWLNNSGPDSLSMSVADFSKALYTNYNSVIEEQYSIKSDKVFNAILKRITRGSYFSQSNQANIQVSLFQFIYTILESKCKAMDFYVHEIASELWLVNQLKSGNSSVTIRSVQSLKGATPSLDIIKTLLILLASPTEDVSNAVGDYWSDMAYDRTVKEAVLPSVLSCLEESRSDIRIGACTCLEKLRAVNTTEELVYVAQADSSRRVQTAARKALSSLNEVTATSSILRRTKS